MENRRKGIEKILDLESPRQQLDELLKISETMPAMNQQEKPAMETGTVLVGVKTADSAILVTDQKASMGSWGCMRSMEKTPIINDRFAMSITGAASHGIIMGEYMDRFVNQWEAIYREPSTMKTVIQIYRSLSMQMRGLHLASILIGVDEDGAHLAEAWGMDPGFFSVGDYLTIGSGSVFAKSVLEQKYKAGMQTMEYRVMDKLDENRKDLFEDFVSRQKALHTGLKGKELSDEALRKVLAAPYKAFMRKAESVDKVDIPNDGLTLALEAALVSAHEDNSNDPAIFTQPPYTVLIAKEGLGIVVPEPAEVTLRWELLMRQKVEDRGFKSGYDIDKLVDGYVNGGGSK